MLTSSLPTSTWRSENAAETVPRSNIDYKGKKSESRAVPRPMRAARKPQLEAKPQRKTVKSKLVGRPEKPAVPARKLAAKTAVKKERDDAKPKLSKDLKEKIAKLQAIEPTSDGHCELNAVVSDALEKELQDLMIKVWQELPDSPPSEAEKLVAEQFRTDLGDDLKNVLGLNVTKRILDVTNPLYVKIEFDNKPYGEMIQRFLRWINCSAMKRVMDGQHTYIAQLRRTADLDRVMHKPVVRIGGLKAKITPYYKFTKCPSKLKTVYKTSVKKTVKTKTENDEQESKTESNTIEESKDANKKEITDKITLESVTAVKQTQIPNVQNTKSESETPKHVEKPKTIETKPVAKTPAASNTAAKPNEVKTTETKVEAPSNKNVTKITPTAKPSIQASKATEKAKTAQAAAKPAQAAAKPAQVTAKPAQATTKPAQATTKPAQATTKPAQAITKPAQATTKPANKPKTTKPVAKVMPSKPKQKKKSDFDELDDEDILALMSNAIVLDECAGSDDD